jgi:hypothetical protein
VILRSSDLGLAPAAAGPGAASVTRLAGYLEESLFLGAYYRHYVRVGDAVLMVDGPAPAAPGPVTITVPPDRVRVYPAA